MQLIEYYTWSKELQALRKQEIQLQLTSVNKHKWLPVRNTIYDTLLLALFGGKGMAQNQPPKWMDSYLQVVPHLYVPLLPAPHF